MNKTIFQHARSMDRNKMALYINDRMNPEDEGKNRIIFEIALLNDSDKKMDSVLFFMEIIDAKYVAHKMLSGQFLVNEDHNIIRGKDGTARAISFTKKPNPKSKEGNLYYTIKIDLGNGTIEENGVTTLQNKEKTMYYNLKEEDMAKILIAIRDRIQLNEILYALKKEV